MTGVGKKVVLGKSVVCDCLPCRVAVGMIEVVGDSSLLEGRAVGLCVAAAA